jgi:hypothetical protein
MEGSTAIDENVWRAEAFEAVLGNDRWICLTAHVAPDGLQLFAVYRMRLTGARRRVELVCAAAPGVDERRAAIRRRLGIVHAEAPSPAASSDKPTAARGLRSSHRRSRVVMKTPSNFLRA